ncbi:hypothetical protein Poli38472_012400 [Pythium oligandrum]|uniref:ELMO domain-containing protein n=1 Tax=Pythium oligandrum TaxID=41045 RepID=A0A8K1CPL6_PYTOL|nr:hypothetical protein Poli38472_012400 [Pythium oligandrum]|eukprot:TMW67284.1 hypothetical protein Poli38472_012400 [Pythium oligandrum]
MTMDATRPLLAGDKEDFVEQTNGHYTNGTHHTSVALLLDDDDTHTSTCCTSCWRVLCCGRRSSSPSSGYKELSSRRDRLLSNGTASSTGSSNGYPRSYCGTGAYETPRDDDDESLCGAWACWKWIFPDRITDYEDFVGSETLGEIYFIRQKTREFFEPANAEDNEMVHNLWNALFPTLPYDGRVNPRWRDIGFQNDDPASDFRASGRFALKMLLYFSEHMNDEFKRLVRENRFPVCLCALNVVEMMLIHLNLKDPLPMVCPCCGTENAELETSHPSRDRPELQGFVSILADCTWSSASNQFNYAAEWPVEVAFAQVFMHAMIVLDSVWRQMLQRDPTTTLMHFREALLETRQKTLAFLARRNTPVNLVELQAWSTRQLAAIQRQPKHSSRTCL